MIDLASLLARGRTSSLRVGIGLPEEAFVKTASAVRRSKCDVHLDRYDDPGEMLRSLRSGHLDAAVRGTMGSSAVLSAMKRSFETGEVMRVAILEAGRPFALAPVGIDEGNDVSSRLRLALSALRYFSAVGWKLRVGVLSKGRPEDRPRGAEIGRSLEDGETICTSIQAEGFQARHYAILVEEAVRDCDLVLAPDGVSGNLMFRALHFVGGAKAYGAPVVNLEKTFVDTSRAKEDFSEPVLLAAGLAECRLQPLQRA